MARKLAVDLIRVGSREGGAVQIMGAIESRDPLLAFMGTDARDYVNDVTEMYCHIVRTISRLISKLDPGGPAVERMDAAILLEKFLSANTHRLDFVDFAASLARDLGLKGGREEADALLTLSKFRTEKQRLHKMSWEEFVYLHPAMMHVVDTIDSPEEDELLEI
jgi:hypothetical protein